MISCGGWVNIGGVDFRLSVQSMQLIVRSTVFDPVSVWGEGVREEGKNAFHVGEEECDVIQ